MQVPRRFNLALVCDVVGQRCSLLLAAGHRCAIAAFKSSCRLAHRIGRALVLLGGVVKGAVVGLVVGAFVGSFPGLGGVVGSISGAIFGVGVGASIGGASPLAATLLSLATAVLAAAAVWFDLTSS